MRIDDVTRTVELNHQLFHSQKMETVGTLAGGLAHEFNNVLGGMVGASSLMKQRILNGQPDLKELTEDLEVIENCTQRAQAMVKRLLALSRRADNVREPIELVAVVKNMVSLCSHSFESRIQVVAKVSEKEIWIQADRSQLEQAILNICVNARDAMKSGGRLTLGIHAFKVDSAFQKKHVDCNESELVELSIQDTGEGIPLAALDQVFEPFFTTKRENGSGLGLSIVDSIMKQNKGYVDLESDAKTGTNFRLYFQKGAPNRGLEALATPNAPRGKGEILLVDDDEIIRRTSARILGELGYTPATASDGASAIRFLENGLHFDLVILDVDMPVMNGLDTAQVLWKLKPDLKIIFCTGRQHQYELGPTLKKPQASLLLKPFDMGDLANTVRKIITAQPAGKISD